MRLMTIAYEATSSTWIRARRRRCVEKRTPAPTHHLWLLELATDISLIETRSHRGARAPRYQRGDAYSRRCATTTPAFRHITTPVGFPKITGRSGLARISPCRSAHTRHDRAHHARARRRRRDNAHVPSVVSVVAHAHARARRRRCARDSTGAPTRRFKLQAEAAWLGSRRAAAHAREATARFTRAPADVDATTRTSRAS